ncbi:hypothetical protein BDN67DRAFT_1016593 [Paxillus ammoniavirescens]|nr:hypothetical protein BDN67DRAFT_1016593 [Paxillus ammoniavirescens]
MDDYQSLYSASRSQNRLNPQAYHQRSSSTSTGYNPSQDSPLGLHAMVLQILAEVRGVNERMKQQEGVITDLQRANEELTVQVRSHQESLDLLQKQLVKKKTNVKGGLNDHPALKPIIHPLFSELCGLDVVAKKQHAQLLAETIQRLPNDEPYETNEAGRQIWHPNWLGNVDDELNARFIKEIADKIYNNEKSRRENTQLKAEIPDEDFDLETITESVKCYFRTIHTRAKTLNDPMKAKVVTDKLVTTHQRARCATVAKARRLAADQFQAEHPDNQSALAMIDTEFGSDILSYDEELLTDDTKRRRKDADVGKTANMAYVAFLRWLSLRAMKMQAGVEGEAATTSATTAPQKRRRKMKNFHKCVFDAAPRKMDDDPPDSKKGTLPFKSMVSERWMNKHPDMKVHQDGREWLEAFYAGLKLANGGEDLIAEDLAHVKELEKWQNRDDMGDDDEDL